MRRRRIDMNSEYTDRELHPLMNDDKWGKVRQAFWAEVVKQFPESVSGDLDPYIFITFETTSQWTISEWLYANVPRDDD
jgi:hypothetical protein